MSRVELVENIRTGELRVEFAGGCAAARSVFVIGREEISAWTTTRTYTAPFCASSTQTACGG